MEHLGIIRRSPLFRGIEEDNLQAMFGCLSVRQHSYGKGAYVLREGDLADAFGFVLEGLVHVVREDFWGNQNLIAKIGVGEIFAESYACIPGSLLPVGVVAQENTIVLFLNVQRVLTTCSTACEHHGVLIRNLASILAAKNVMLNEKLQHITQRSTQEKLLSFLSAQSRQQGSATFDIPFNRQQLADYLSIDRSAMSGALCRLRDEGVLAFHKNHFTLKA